MANLIRACAASTLTVHKGDGMNRFRHNQAQNPPPHDLDTGVTLDDDGITNEESADVLDALIVDAHRHSKPPVDILPIANLFSEPSETQTVYAIARVDGAGRLHDRAIIDAASWLPGERVSATIYRSTIILLPNETGQVIISVKRTITIPSFARNHFFVHPSDRILLAAIPRHRAVIAYPAQTISKVLAEYHAAEFDQQ
jgi:hypothetical protein